jgi:hypothetical protein
MVFASNDMLKFWNGPSFGDVTIPCAHHYWIHLEPWILILKFIAMSWSNYKTTIA